MMNVTEGASLARVGVRTVSATVHARDDVTELYKQRDVVDGVMDSVLPNTSQSCHLNTASRSHPNIPMKQHLATTQRSRHRGHVAWASSPSPQLYEPDIEEEHTSLEDGNSCPVTGK